VAVVPVAPAPQPRPRVPTELTDTWIQWIAENRLRDCAPADMLATMTAAGIDRDEAAAALTRIEHDPVFLAARRHQQVLRKLESVVANQQRVWQSASDYTQVERRVEVGHDEFLERYVRGCRPVVLTGLARDWPALERWSPAYFRQHFGHLDVEVQRGRASDPAFEVNKLQHRHVQRLADFIDEVVGGGPTNDYYMTANNEVLRRPEFARVLDDVGTLPSYVDASRLSSASSLWLGPAGTITPLHHDLMMLLHTQVVGRKRWRLISPLETPRVYNHVGVFSPVDVDRPDLARYPEFAKVQVVEVLVEPGETLFVPLAWWHQVTSLDISISLSFTNLAVANEFTYVNPSLRDW